MYVFVQESDDTDEMGPDTKTPSKTPKVCSKLFYRITGSKSATTRTLIGY